MKKIVALLLIGCLGFVGLVYLQEQGIVNIPGLQFDFLTEQPSQTLQNQDSSDKTGKNDSKENDSEENDSKENNSKENDSKENDLEKDDSQDDLQKTNTPGEADGNRNGLTESESDASQNRDLEGQNTEQDKISEAYSGDDLEILQLLDVLSEADAITKGNGWTVAEEMQFFNYKLYDNEKWKLVLGELGEDKINAYSALKDYSHYQTNEIYYLKDCNMELQYAHLFAAMQGSYNGIDFCGWLGDLIQLAKQMESEGATDPVNRALELFGDDNGHMGPADICSDLMGSSVAIALNGNALSETVSFYFSLMGKGYSQEAIFLYLNFGLVNPTADEVEAALQNQMQMFDQVWNYMGDLVPVSRDSAALKGSLRAFAIYLSENGKTTLPVEPIWNKEMIAANKKNISARFLQVCSNILQNVIGKISIDDILKLLP